MVTTAYMGSRACKMLVLLLFVTTTLGCTALRPVTGTDRETISAQVSVGDRIEVTRLDHSIINFKVDEISESGIGGGGLFIHYRDIRQVRSKKIRLGRTAFGIVGGVAIVLILAIVAAEPAFFPAP